METASFITPRTSPYVRKREATPESKPLSRAEARRLGDLHAISLIEEGLKGEYISREEIMRILDE